MREAGEQGEWNERPKELAVIVKDDAAKPREWDSGPVELVSRVLDVDDEASFQEIGKMFEILTAGAKARRRYRAFTDQWCGLHVHIGLPTTSIRSSKIASESKDHLNSEDNTIPLPVLQHLAYIIVVYEPIISLLHPPNRRPSHANAKTDLLGNRDEFFAEPDYSRIDWDLISLNYDSQSDSGYNSGCGSGGSYAEATLKFPGPDSKCWKKKGMKAEKNSTQNIDEDEAIEATEDEDEEDDDPNSEPHLRTRAHTLIFPPPSHRSHPMTLPKLCALMCSGNDRSHLINWTYLLRDPDPTSPTKYTEKGIAIPKGARTLEFRQHEACFDGEEVRCWVRFCAGLVRWGERGVGALERWREGRDASGMVDMEEEEKGMKRHEEEEEWFQEYYGRGEVGMKELVEGMGLDAEMRAWVERRVEMGKNMEREEEMRKVEVERRKKKRKAEIERKREWSPY